MRAEENKTAVRIRTQDSATHWSMEGKTVLFTGASRGMGRLAAIELARLGAEVLVVGHNPARGHAAVEAIRRTGGSAQFLRADMGDAAEVCALAAAVLARGGPVHVLIHSAGGLLPADARTREGVDRGFAQNFLGAFLLTRLLEDRVLASTPARVIAVGSGAHRLVKTADIDPLATRPSAIRGRPHALRLAHLLPLGPGRQRPRKAAPRGTVHRDPRRTAGPRPANRQPAAAPCRCRSTVRCWDGHGGLVGRGDPGPVARPPATA